jgi:hypothetical protein
MFAKIAIIAAIAVASTSATGNNFGDLSFLNNEKSFHAAEAARAKFVKEHMRLAAIRRHKTLAYFRAHHHAGYKHKLYKMFAAKLRARIAAHKRSIHAHHKSIHHHNKALAKRRHAWKALKKARHAHHKAVHHKHMAKKYFLKARAHLIHSIKVMHHKKHVRNVWHARWMHARKVVGIWNGRVKAAARHFHHMKKVEAVWRHRRAHSLKRRTAAHNAWKKAAHHYRFAKVARRVAIAKWRRSRAAAIKANKKVHAHAKKGMAAGHI